MMESNWSSFDGSPAAQKENNNPAKKAGDERGITIAGSGMEARRDPAADGLSVTTAMYEANRPQKKQPAGGAKSSFWDF